MIDSSAFIFILVFGLLDTTISFLGMQALAVALEDLGTKTNTEKPKVYTFN